jgi:hypothetical protein
VSVSHVTTYKCDACGKEASSRYEARWYRVAMGRGVDEGDPYSPERGGDACDAGCAAILVTQWAPELAAKVRVR